MKMNLLEQEKSALRIARRFNKILECGTGIIGGTVGKKDGELDTIRLSDRCLVSARGVCNRHHHRHLPDVGITECDISYKPDLEFLKKIFPEISYVSGLSVANTVMRSLMHGMPFENLNSASFDEVMNTSLLPIIVWPERDTPEKMLSVPIEDFRTMREDRPKWCLRRSPIAEKYGCYTCSKDGFYKKLSDDEIELSSEYMSPCANGVRWILDYALLGIVNNPYAAEKQIVMAGGNHWPGTFAANAMMCLVTKVPEKRTIFRNTVSSMARIAEVVEKEGLDNFQVLLRITDDIQFNGDHEINIDVISIYPIPS
ncbi:hypothetical protein KAS31_01585 [Candidatus Parcubacteria bacterium]|nr:hypothetical protein [Candidatus Parcubacteria bacterium]